MRYFVWFGYDGAAYHGWQIQPNGTSVQEKLEQGLSTLLRTSISVTGAGRTDAGVNATEMVAHFDVGTEVDTEKLTKKLNRFLPADIGIRQIVRVRDDAHARFDAKARTYRYFVSTGKFPMTRHYSYRFPLPLDFEKMNEAASHLMRYTDFTSFSKLHTDTKTNNCKISHARWTRIDNEPLLEGNESASELWMFEIRADRFLRNMVRAVVGTLLEVGRGKMSIEDFCKVIERKDRCEAGTSVPGNALFLAKVEYEKDIFIF